MLIQHVSEVIGNTPILKIGSEVHGLGNVNLYAKLELFNPFGSLKDRGAWNILKDELGQLKEKRKIVVDSSSGNMSKAMQMLCAAHDIPCKVVTNRIKVKETKQILQLLGVQFEELPGSSLCHDPTDPNDPVFVIERMMRAEPDKYFFASQYSNEKNPEAHYETTGPEILNDVGVVDVFVGSLGTTGSTSGAGRYLKEHNPNIKIIGVTGEKGQLLPGIRNFDEMFEVGLFHRDFYDEILPVSVDDAIDGVLTLVRKCGVLAGPSSGGCFSAAINYLKTVSEASDRTINAVFIVCDRLEWYLSYLQKSRPSLFNVEAKRNVIDSLSHIEVDNAPQIDVSEVENWLTVTQHPCFMIDLRGSLAFKASRIPGSINVPADYLSELANWGGPFPNKASVLFICPTGDQSKKFAAYYSSLGMRCASLTGGFLAWRDAGMTLERSAPKNSYTSTDNPFRQFAIV